MEASRYHLYALQITSIYPPQPRKGACTPVWCSNYSDCCPGTPLDHLTLMPKGLTFPGIQEHSRERILNYLHRRAQQQRLGRLKHLSGNRPII